MGCDIHIYREKLVNGQWITGDTWTPPDPEWPEDRPSHEEVGGNRNYHVFSVLARVRCDEPPAVGLAPRGLPLQMSKEVAIEAQEWGCDGHSHSHLYLHELEELLALLNSSTVHITGMKRKEGLASLRASIASGDPDWNLLYPYCRWCSDEVNYEHFEVDVPAAFACGAHIQEIIDGLHEIGGDMQRVVFWFDN